MIKIAAYCRVSTDSLDQANSFQAQQRYFLSFINNHHDYELYEIYADEGISGTTTKNRTQFIRMMDDAKHGCFQRILTKEVSRFSRNLLDTILYTRKLKDYGVSVCFITDGIDTVDPDAELRLSIMASIAQEESRKTSARVTWGQTRQMERGVVFGRSLLGYTVKSGQISVEPIGADTVRMIFHKFVYEEKSASQIARDLSDAGRLTSFGSDHWTAGSVLRILRNEKYTGDLIQKKTYTPNYLTHEKRYNRGEVPFVIVHDHHEPIIPQDLWDKAQTKMTPQHKTNRASCTYPFSGKIICGNCGNAFRPQQKLQKNRKSYLRWCCSSGCGIGRVLRNEDVEGMVRTSIQYVLTNRFEFTRELSSDLLTLLTEEASDDKHIERIKRKKTNMLDRYFAEEISKEEMMRLRSLYDRQINENTKPDLPDSKIPEQAINRILDGTALCDSFYRSITECVMVYQERTMVLRLTNLNVSFVFA